MLFRFTALLRPCAGVVAGIFVVSAAGAVGRFVPGDFDTIQAAIDASSSGDIITVAPGTYTENVTLKSGVDVRGREAARTILTPADANDPAVLASGIDDVTFGNFSIVDAQVAIDVVNSSNIQLVNSVIDTALQFGVRVDIDSQVDILNDVFWANAVAITRATDEAQVTNSAFVGNVVTISSPLGGVIGPAVNVDYCGFFDNDDLKSSGVDTPLGTNSVVGDPRFVDTDNGDFHLRDSSPFIDTGVGNDSIDNSLADIGAWGGQFADPWPFPLPAPAVSDASASPPPPYSVDVSWEANLAYLVTNSTNAGTYRVYYQQNQAGPPYGGTDAGNGTQPSPVEAGDATSITLDNLQPAAPAPAAPQLLAADPLAASVALSWSVVTDAVAYRVYWGTASVDENVVDVGDVTAYTVGGLTNGVTYLFAVSALQQPIYHFSVTALDNTQNRNESDFSPESTIAIGPMSEGAQSNQLSASPAVTIPYPDLPDKGCFVATAAFGADWVAEVQALRDFRDRYLMTNRAGRAFVALYYRHGPAAARAIEPHESLKAVVRGLLAPLVAVALVLSGMSAATAALLAMLFSVLIVIRRRLQARVTAARRIS